MLGIPCVTLREQTERPITITHGTNRMAPWPLTVEGIVTTLDDALSKRSEPRRPEGWDGSAAQRIVRALRIGSETADPGVTRPADRRASGNRAAGTA